jgi:UMF1 family MFS transporter
MILALLVTQLLGLPFSILFGRLADRLGAYKMIGFAIFWYFLICLVGFYMGISIETTHGTAHTAAIHTGTILFWIMAGMVGMVQGGIQALSRSQFGQMIPRHRSNEYFGFFNIFSRFSSILGPLFMAVVTGLTGKSAFGILSIVILFAIGGLMLWNAYGKREELHA